MSNRPAELVGEDLTIFDYNPFEINTPEKGHAMDSDNANLFTSLDHRDPQALDHLLGHVLNINVSEVVDGRGRLPLHKVVSNLVSTGLSGMRMIKALLANGADPSARDAMGVTPLHLTNSAMVTRLLCDSGADVLAADCKGRSVLAFSADNVPDEDARICGLKAKVAEGGPLLIAMRDAKNGATACQRYAHHDSQRLYEATLGISETDFTRTMPPTPRLRAEEVDNNGKTILHYATASFPSNGSGPNTSLVAYLINSQKCLPTDVDDEGRSALHDSVNHHEALAAGGWSPYLTNNDGDDPLDICLTPDLCFFSTTLAAFSGLPAELVEAYRYTCDLLKDGAAEEIVAAIVKAEEEREASDSKLIPYEPSQSFTYAWIVACGTGDYDVLEEAMALFALIDVRARILHQCRRKKHRCEAVINTATELNGSNPPPPLFTEITDENGMTAVDMYLGEQVEEVDEDYDWVICVPKFFEKVLPIIDSLQ